MILVIVYSVLNGSVKFSMYSQVPLTCTDNLLYKNHAGSYSFLKAKGWFTDIKYLQLGPQLSDLLHFI